VIAAIVNAVLDHIPWYVYAFVIGLALVASIPYWLPVWNVLPNWLRWLLVAIVTTGLAYFAGRNKAAKDAAAAREKANANAIANRQKVDAKIAGTSDAGVASSLDKWMRE
jgi:membrane protein required for beta-lactamase induction